MADINEKEKGIAESILAISIYENGNLGNDEDYTNVAFNLYSEFRKKGYSPISAAILTSQGAAVAASGWYETVDPIESAVRDLSKIMDNLERRLE